MIQKIKTDVDRLLLVLKIKKSQFYQNLLEISFLLTKLKVAYLLVQKMAYLAPFQIEI